MQRTIIVGASHAGARLAASLRQEKWTDEIVLIGDESRITFGQTEIRLGHHLRHVRHHRSEERPALVVVRQRLQPAAVVPHPLLERRTRAVPAGQHHARLRPRQDPRDGTEV